MLHGAIKVKHTEGHTTLCFLRNIAYFFLTGDFRKSQFQEIYCITRQD